RDCRRRRRTRSDGCCLWTRPSRRASRSDLPSAGCARRLGSLRAMLSPRLRTRCCDPSEKLSSNERSRAGPYCPNVEAGELAVGVKCAVEGVEGKRARGGEDPHGGGLFCPAVPDPLVCRGAWRLTPGGVCP